MATETPLDRFKAVLGGAARAIADEPEVELAFTADAPVQSGKHMKVPMPARAAARRSGGGGARVRRRLRAAAASTTTPRCTRAARRREAVARAVFDAVESARVEALGSARLCAGSPTISATALDVRLRSDPITRARTPRRGAAVDRARRCWCASG